MFYIFNVEFYPVVIIGGKKCPRVKGNFEDMLFLLKCKFDLLTAELEDTCLNLMCYKHTVPPIIKSCKIAVYSGEPRVIIETDDDPVMSHMRTSICKYVFDVEEMTIDSLLIVKFHSMTEKITS